MARRPAPPQKAPTVAPDRALKALAQQLDVLQNLKGHKCQEVKSERSNWDHGTQSIIEAAYGDPSPELSRFHGARSAGTYNMMGISPQQQQQNYDLQVQQLDALLQAFITALRLQLPEEEVQGVYEPGDEYAFYRDLNALIQQAEKNILFVDAYLDEDLFNLYVSKVPDNVAVRILSNKIGPNVETVARMYAKRRPLELRSSGDIHDRAIFLDERGWVTGQSIKDAAKRKPTYLIELEEPLLAASRDIHNKIWAAAHVII